MKYQLGDGAKETKRFNLGTPMQRGSNRPRNLPINLRALAYLTDIFTRYTQTA